MSSHKTILDEHEKLDLLLRDLRAVSRWDTGLLREERVRLKLADDLKSLKIRLRQHFDTEESGYYLEEIRNRKPSATDTLKVLQAEHPRFLEQISSLEARCREGGNAEYGDLLTRLSWMLDLLKHHEEKENALIKEVFQY